MESKLHEISVSLINVNKINKINQSEEFLNDVSSEILFQTGNAVKRDDLFGHKQINALSEHDYIWSSHHQVT